MSKKIIFKVLLSGFVVFMLLPTVFDEEETKDKKPAFAQAYDFAPDGYEGEETLPILDEPSGKENVFTKYSKRFKRLYGRAFAGPVNQASGQQANNAESDDESLYVAMAALFDFDKTAPKQPRSSFKSNDADGGSVNAIAYTNSPAAYLNGSSTSVKQIIDGNAPVKGLYESSAIESYETRSKAKQVYKNVMNKVDNSASKRIVSSTDNEGVETELYASASTDNIGAGYDAFNKGNISGSGEPYGDVDQVSAGNNKFNSPYKGISSRLKSGQSGSYGSYGKGGTGNAGDSDLSSNFEAAAGQTSNKVNTAAGIIKDSNKDKDNGGSESSGGTGSSEGDSSGNKGEGTPGGQDPGPITPPPGDNPDNGGPVKPDTVPAARDKKFNADAYDKSEHASCEVGELDNNAGGGFGSKLKDVVLSHDHEKVSDADAKKKDDKIDALCATPLPGAQPLNEDVKKKKIVVDLGLADGHDKKVYRATPTYLALPSKGLGQIGILDYVGGEGDIGGELFKGISPSDFAKEAKGNSIVVTVSQEVAESYLGKSVLIREGDLESKKGLISLSKKLNDIPGETARIVKLKALREAAAKKKAEADLAKRKKEIVDVKTIPDTINGR